MTQKTYRENQFVYVTSERKNGKIKAIIREIPAKYKVEIITSFDRNTGERTTKLITVSADDIKPYRQKRQHKPLTLKVKYFDKEIPKLEKFETGDWVDLRAAETIEMKQGDFKLIPLGVGMKLPKGYEANIVPRSSTFKNFGIIQTNHYSVIDQSYSGNEDQWFYPALAIRDTVIQKGDRICQFRINKKMPKVEFVTVEKLDGINRGGLGSTGTK